MQPYSNCGLYAKKYNLSVQFLLTSAVIVCADHGKAWVRPFDKKQTTDIDASILTDHMMLQATELGLGSVWICYFKPDVIRRESGRPDNGNYLKSGEIRGNMRVVKTFHITVNTFCVMIMA